MHDRIDDHRHGRVEIGVFENDEGRFAAKDVIRVTCANGMMQFAVWTALTDLGLGVNLQHYNPVIDETVKKMFGVPDSWKLIAQMPFGGIAAEPQAKDKEDIKARVKVFN